MKLSSEILAAAKCLWSYHRLGHALEPAEIILVFGSSDLRVARHAADLWKGGYAPRILFSGARGRMTGDWAETEASAMAKVAMEAGVPEEWIIREERATNTGENIRFSRELLLSQGIPHATAIVVQKPYMERRTFAALDVQWPDLKCRTSSPAVEFEDYCTEELPPELVIAAMTGDFQRILEYPALGFAAAQEVGEAEMKAYRLLVEEGFDSQLRRG